MPRKQKTTEVLKGAFRYEGSIGSCNFEAGASEKELPKLKLKANSGKPMRLQGYYYPLVMDLKGTVYDRDVTPILMDHDPSKRIGHTTSQSITENEVSAEGLVSSTSDHATSYVADAKNGMPFQVSVGADSDDIEFFGANDTVNVNGTAHKGPIYVAWTSKIRELSVVVLGADKDTQANLAAQAQFTQGISSMDFIAWVESLGIKAESLSVEQKDKLQVAFNAQQKPVSVDTATITEKINAVAAETATRIASINATTDEYNEIFAGTSGPKLTVGDKKLSLREFQAHALKSNMSPQDYELAVLRASRNAPTKGPAIHVSQTITDLSANAVTCALLRATRAVPMQAKNSIGENYGLEAWYKPEVLEASDNRHLRNMSLHALMDMQIIHATGHGYVGNRKSDAFISATRDAIRTIRASGGHGMSTLDITNIFEDAANKVLLAAYSAVQTTWQQWAGTISVSDFKTTNLYRLGDDLSYEKIGNNGELKHGKFTEDKYTIAAETYGKIVGLTRTNIINDDLGAFTRVMGTLGMRGALVAEELAYVQLLTNRDTKFHTNNKNVITGASTVFGVDSMTALSGLMNNQVDAQGASIGITADRLLVGNALRVEAGRMFAESRISEGPSSTKTGQVFMNNPHVGAYTPIASGYIDNTALLQQVVSKGDAIPNQSATQFFLLGNPNSAMGAIVNLAFLNGVQTPIIEQSDAAFDVLGMQWRAYHDVGAGDGDPKLAARSKGAA